MFELLGKGKTATENSVQTFTEAGDYNVRLAAPQHLVVVCRCFEQRSLFIAV
jgi:hypothetical protein